MSGEAVSQVLDRVLNEGQSLQRRPQSSLGHLTANEFVAQRQALHAVAEVACSG
jgi:hypothetical protein